MATQSLAGKVCMVTGANSGIGRATAERLAGMGATVVMACRDRGKGERAVEEARKRSGNESVELMLVDLASFDSVRSLAHRFEEEHDALHVLVNNAGVARVRRSVTTDGNEYTFQVNYLSHFLLTNLLLDLLKKSAPSRVVNVSSTSHFGGRIDFDNLEMEEGYGVMKAYSRSKLAQVLFTYELARRLEGTEVTVNCLHPGAVATNIWSNYLGPASFLGKLSRLFLASPTKGAETPVYLASSPKVEGVSGKYFEKKTERRSSAASYEEAAAKRLWEASASLVGLNTP